MRHGADPCLARPLPSGAASVPANGGPAAARPATGPFPGQFAGAFLVRAEARQAELQALPAPIRAPANVPSAAVIPSEPAPERPRAAMALLSGAGVALFWAGLAGTGAEGWLFGAPAVLAGGAIGWALAPATGWRIAPLGALRFAGWFAAQAVRGSVDVALRAFHPRLPVAPGWRRHPVMLPPGAPRLVMANAITLLPGTLTAELHDDHMILHLLDVREDPSAELLKLESRVRALFALPPLTVFPEVRP